MEVLYMKKNICLLLTLIVLFVTTASAEKPAENTLKTIISGMTLRDKAAQMMIASFRTWQEEPEDPDKEKPPAVKITELNEPIMQMIERDRFGGILLFGENFEYAEQTLRLVDDMQTSNRKGGGIPLIIAVDEEGGNVARLNYGTIGIGNMALGATGDPENAYTMAAILGEEIGLLGINANYAPVVDVNNNPANPVIGIRSFSDDAQAVSEYGKAFIRGLHDKGIMATVKHFPGHGDTDTDSHTGFPVINKSIDELMETELVPFKAAIEAGADMVMTAHIQFPQIEKETYTSLENDVQVYLPATMSHTILTDILREDLGFNGVIVSDALDMDAVSKNFSLEDTLRLSINAGVDMLILPIVKDIDLFRETETWLDTAVALVESGDIKTERIDDAVLRILTLKQKYGLLDQTDFTVTEKKISAAEKSIGSRVHKKTEWEIAEKALTLVKNDNSAFPLQMKEGDKTLILFADSCASRSGAGDLVRKMLKERKALPEGAEINVLKVTKGNEKACVSFAEKADHLILVHRVYTAACLDPSTEDGFSSGTFDRVIQAVHKKGKTVIVVSCQLPYDAARFPDADAILLTYGSSAMSKIPQEGSSWSPNLPAGLLACFGQGKPEGVLPVNIPELDEHYRPTDKIMFPRQEK